MSKRDPILTPELIKILKIFFFSALGLMLFFSFFNERRADNTGEDRTFKVADSDRLFFQNLRSVYYEREVRQDASMILYRHRSRFQSDTLPTLDLVILMNPAKDEAYIYFELKNGDGPVQIRVKSSGINETYDFANGNNLDHFELFTKLIPAFEQQSDFELVLNGKAYSLWSGEKEKQYLKTMTEDYIRLLANTD